VGVGIAVVGSQILYVIGGRTILASGRAFGRKNVLQTTRRTGADARKNRRKTVMMMMMMMVVVELCVLISHF